MSQPRVSTGPAVPGAFPSVQKIQPFLQINNLKRGRYRIWCHPNTNLLRRAGSTALRAAAASFLQQLSASCSVLAPHRLRPATTPNRPRLPPEAAAGRLLHLDTAIRGPALQAPSDTQARTRPQAARLGAPKGSAGPRPGPGSVVAAPSDAERRLSPQGPTQAERATRAASHPPARLFAPSGTP